MSDGIPDDSLKLSEARDEVFRAFGRVAYAAQIFESDLITLLIMLELFTHVEDAVKKDPESFLNKKAVGKWWQANSKSIEEELDRFTLGQLLKGKLGQAQNNLERLTNESRRVVSDEQIASITKQLDALPTTEWDTALEHRNYLFHRFWYHADDKLADIEDCQKLQISLEQCQEEFERHVERVREALQTIKKILGYQ